MNRDKHFFNLQPFSLTNRGGWFLKSVLVPKPTCRTTVREVGRMHSSCCLPPWCCNNKQRKVSVCAVRATPVLKQNTAWKLGCPRCAYTHRESANSEPDRIPVQLRNFIMALKTSWLWNDNFIYCAGFAFLLWGKIKVLLSNFYTFRVWNAFWDCTTLLNHLGTCYISMYCYQPLHVDGADADVLPKCATQESWSPMACLWSSFCRNYHLWHWWLLTRSFGTGARILLSTEKILHCSWTSRCYQVQLRKSLNLGLLPGQEGAACAAASSPSSWL